LGAASADFLQPDVRRSMPPFVGFPRAARYDDVSADAKTQRRFGMLEILNDFSDPASLSKV